MAFNIRKFLEGLKIVPKSSTSIDSAGEMEVLSSDNKLQYHNGTSKSPVVTEAHSATLSNKTIDTASSNTIKVNGNTLSASAGTATVTIPNATDTLVGKATTDTLSNKTIDTASSNTIKINGNTLSASAGTATVTVPNVTDTLVGKATTDVLTNKTLSGNTATNLVNGSGTVNINSSGTVTLPNATDTLVGKATSDTLTNKSLSDSTTAIVDVSDPTKQIKFDAAGTTGTSTTLTGSQTASRVLTLPDATDTLIGKATTDTLTNKTFDAQGTGNSLTNITDTNIKTGAAINRAKLASGSANHVIINDGSGVLSSEASLAISRGGTGQATKTAGFDALSPTTTAGDVIVHNGTNNVRQAIGSDGQVLVADSSQTNKLKWTTLQQGAKNYITNGGFENNSVNSWSSVGCATVTNSFPASVGSGGAAFSAANGGRAKNAATADPSVISSGQLAGNYSLSWGFTTTGTAGDMLISPAIVLDLEAQASVQTFSFFYKVASSSGSSINFSGTSSNTLGVAIYDITNNAWIQPAGVFNIVQSSGVAKASGTFQVPSNTTQVQVAVYIANTQTSSSLTVYIDDFVLGPQVVQYGAPVTDWVLYTPTMSGGTPANGTLNGRYRRVGDSMEIEGSLEFSGAAGAFSTVLVTIPSFATIDTSKFSLGTVASDRIRVGNASMLDSGVALYPGTVSYASTTQIQVYRENVSGSAVGNTPITNASPFSFAASDVIQWSAKVPIVGWSSTVQMSNDTDTRVVAFSAYDGATVTATNTTVLLPIGTTDVDTHTARSSNTYVVPVSGFYRISAKSTAKFSAGNAAFSHSFIVYKNGNPQNGGDFGNADGVNSSGLEFFYLSVNSIFRLNAGDIIDFRYVTNYTGTVTTYLKYCSLERLSGPSAIAASETVAEVWSNSAGTAVGASGVAVAVPFATKVISTHGAWNGSSTFTAPVSGLYKIDVMLGFIVPTSSTGGGTFDIFLNKSGVAFGWARSVQSVVNSINTIICSRTVRLNAGEQVDPSMKMYWLGATTPTLWTDAAMNTISIVRVGN